MSSVGMVHVLMLAFLCIQHMGNIKCIQLLYNVYGVYIYIDDLADTERKRVFSTYYQSGYYYSAHFNAL